MLWIGLVLIAVAVLLVFLARRSVAKAGLMMATETSRVGDIEALVREIAADLPGGECTGYSQFAELKGTLVCDDPLEGELSGERAAICETRVERMIETRHERRDDQGHVTTEWRKSTEVLSQHRRESPFYLDDGTGRVRVMPAGSKLELAKVVDRFEPPGSVERASGEALSVGIGSFRLSLASSATGARRTVGYKFLESILPVDRPI